MKRPTQALLIAPDKEMRADVISGLKQITIREGHRGYTAGLAALYCPEWPWAVHVDITEVKHCTLAEVTPEEWQADGFISQDDMLEGLRRFYPMVTLQSPVTVIRWTNVRGEYVDNPPLHQAHLETLPDRSD